MDNKSEVSLIDVDLKRFKEKIYDKYLKLFPISERKPYKLIEKMVNKGITKIWGITDNNIIVGFMIVNKVKNNTCIHLDYFAIFQEYQSKGYGTKAIKQLVNKYPKHYKIFIEIEKVGEGKNKQENEIREKRAKFYERLGFSKMNFDIYLYGVTYSAYILNYCNDDLENIKKDIYKIYNEILGNIRMKLHCKFI